MSPKDDDVDIAALLKARTSSPGAGVEAAKAMGVTPSTISRWATRASIPKDDAVPLLAAYLELSERDVLWALHLARRKKGNPEEERLAALEESLSALNDDVRHLKDEWAALRDQLARRNEAGPQPRGRGRAAAPTQS